MLTKKQKSELTKMANSLKIKFQIGKNEITDNVLNTLENGIRKHELIKIDVMKSVSEDTLMIALDVSSKLNAEIVQIIGNTFVLYRRNKENPRIQLSK